MEYAIQPCVSKTQMSIIGMMASNEALFFHSHGQWHLFSQVCRGGLEFCEGLYQGAQMVDAARTPQGGI